MTAMVVQEEDSRMAFNLSVFVVVLVYTVFIIWLTVSQSSG